jgi:hypothetical protein
MPLTPVRTRIDHPVVWADWSLGVVDALRVELRAGHFSAIDDLLEMPRRAPTQSMRSF